MSQGSALHSTNLLQLVGTTIDVNSGNKSAGTLRVTIATDQVQLTNALKVDGSAVTQPVSIASVPSHAVTNAGTFAVQAAQSGTWNITNVSGTVSLPTGASTAAKQPALGTAGTASADVITVQGIASMTALKVDGSAVTQPVSGTFWQATQPVSGTVTATIAAGATTIAKAEDVASADADVGVGVLAVRKATPANTSGTDGDYEFLQISAGRLWTSAVIDTALPAGANAIGKLAANSGVTIGAVEIASAQTLATVTTVSTVTNLSQLGGTAIAMNTGTRSAGTQRVTIATDDVVPASQSGTWNITNVSGTVSLPTGAATAAKQPAFGTAGTASADVITVQGIASMTALKVDGSAVTQPVSGTITATIAAAATTIAKAEDVASADADVGVPAMAVRKATPANTSGTDGDYEMLQISAGRLWTSAVIDTALPAGANAIGKLAANSGVTIGAVEIASAQTLATVTTVSTVTNISQLGGAAIAMGTGTRSSGTQRVTIATDDVVPASQSGTWTVQPGNTANTTAWKVDGSAVTQPVSLASVPSHAVTNAGTFAVQAAESDGANVTLGAKADAKSTATDTTAVSAMSVLKQISASVQAPPSQAVTNAGTFAVQADTEMPAAATLADGTTNPSTPLIGSATEVFNGTTWDRLRSPSADGQASTGLLLAVGGAFNAFNYDRTYNNTEYTLISSAARTATNSSSDQQNYNWRGIVISLNVSVVGTGSITLKIEGKDSASGNYYTILTGGTVTTGVMNVYRVYPGITATANTTASDVIPRVWRVTVTHNNANTITYSVGFVGLV